MPPIGLRLKSVLVFICGPVILSKMADLNLSPLMTVKGRPRNRLNGFPVKPFREFHARPEGGFMGRIIHC